MRILSILLLLVLPSLSSGQQIVLPNKPDSFRFAVIGDNGTGDRREYEIGAALAEYRSKFPFNLVLMMGDNLYGGEAPRDFVKKFGEPYAALLSAGVKFYASLGNHDHPDQRFYKDFNMKGESYYTFSPLKDVRFFALDSNYMDKKQLAWLESELRKSGARWKICFFHHPLYSSGGTHGSAVQLRSILEPLFFQNGVSVVFSGHEHFYERLQPQRGIHYFISGAAGQLRRGDIRRTDLTAKGFDQDNHFMLVEIDGDQMYFQAVSRTKTIVDSGVIEVRKDVPEKGPKITKAPTSGN